MYQTPFTEDSPEKQQITGLSMIANIIESHTVLLPDVRETLHSLNGQAQFVRRELLAPFTTNSKADEKWVIDQRILEQGVEAFIKERHFIDIMPKKRYKEAGIESIAESTQDFIRMLKEHMKNPALDPEQQTNVAKALQEVLPDKQRTLF